MKKRMTGILTAAALSALMLSLSLAPAYAAVAVKANSAPVAENLELTTYRGISVGGQLSAVDPEGDLVTFSLTTAPIKGELCLEEDGAFVYSPLNGKKGKDYFGFRATDSSGNVSQEATAIIKIEKKKTSVEYQDMQDNAGYYAALYLAENDIFVGQCLGGGYLFEPEREVTRGEFLAMCMKAADTKLISGVSKTGFSDDANMPLWVKPYVSTALMSGVITGYAEAGTAVFNANAPVSYSEAAVILDRVLGVADVSTTNARVSTAPIWAYQSVVNMTACNIIPRGANALAVSLTREDAAQMLLNAMNLIRNR
jgi:hypothetical protein